MTAMEPLTEQAVASMIKILDRYESFVTLFGHAIKDPVNDPLNELISRLPGLFLPSVSLETQKAVIDMLVQYILHPLINRKICDGLFLGITDTLQNASISNRNITGKLFLLAVLNSECQAKEKLLSGLILPILKLLDMKTIGEILHAAIEKAQRSNAKRKHSSQPNTADHLGFFLRIILCSSTCPSTVLLQEIAKIISTKSWRSSGFLASSAPFFEGFEKALQLIRIRERKFCHPVVGYTLYTSPLWNADRITLQFSLPFIQEYANDGLSPPQTELIQYLLEQANSKQFCWTVLGLSKQQITLSLGLEKQIVAVMVRHLQCFDEEVLFANWMHIFNQVLNAGLCHFVRFKSIVHNLEAAIDGIKLENLSTGRFYCIWLFYQWIALQSNQPIKDFVGSLQLIAKMFPEEEYLHVPELSSRYSIIHLSPGYLWAHVARRANSEKVSLPCGTPRSLLGQLDFIRGCIDRAVLPTGLGFLDINLEHIAVVNCFVPMLPGKSPEANHMDHCDKMVASLIENLVESPTASFPESMPAPGGSAVFRATKPLSLELLDGLSSHARLSLSNSLSTIFGRTIADYASKPEKIFLSPGFWETNARLCVYEENEPALIGFGIRRLPEIAVTHRAWFVLAGELELLAFRFPYIPMNWKPNFLVMIMSLLQKCLTTMHSHPQVLLYLDQLAIRVIQSFNVDDMNQNKSYLSESKVIQLQQELEEILRLLLLTSIRLAQISGLDAANMQFLTKYISEAQQIMPHTWGNPGIQNGNAYLWNTLPEQVQNLYKDIKISRDKSQIRRFVDELTLRIRSAANEADVRNMMLAGQQTPSLYLYCMIWKQLVDVDQNMPFRSPALMATILEKVAYKGQMQNLRIFIDYIIMELTVNAGQAAPSTERINRQLDCLRQMIWKFGIIPLDRFIFSLIMRHFDLATEMHMALYMVSYLCKSYDFQSRLTETANVIPPDFWNHDETFFDKLVTYHQKFPETYYFNGTYDFTQPVGAAVSHEPLPLYFSNVILRCVPIFDIVIHRFLELPKNAPQHFETFLDNVGKAFRFHDRPVTFLWQTLQYYDNHLKDAFGIRRKLVRTVLSAKAEHYLPNFYVTRYFEAYLTAPQPDAFIFPVDYYELLVGRLLVCLYSHNLECPYQNVEWRFHEYPNPTAHALYTSSIELICIPGLSETVTENLLNILRRRFPSDGVQSKEFLLQNYEQFQQCLNCVALIFSAVPERLFVGLLTVLRALLEDMDLITAGGSLFDMLDLKISYCSAKNVMHATLLQLLHSIVLQGSFGHFSKLLDFFHATVVPLVAVECQLVYVLNLFVPLFQKLSSDPARLTKLFLGILTMAQRVGSQERVVFLHTASVRDVLFYMLQTFGGAIDLKKERVNDFLSTVQPEYRTYMGFLQQFVKGNGDVVVQP